MSLTAISPIDGRYSKQVQSLQEYFSEYALIKYRVIVEIEYLFLLSDKKFLKLTASAKKHLRSVMEHFSVENAEAIKEIEKTTNHDVKRWNIFLKVNWINSCQERKNGFILDLHRRIITRPFLCFGSIA